MPTFEVTSPDGTVIEVTGPAGSTKEQAIEYAKATYKPQSMVDRIPGQANAPTQGAPAHPAVGGAEALLSMGTGAVGGVVGQLAGIIQTLTSGKFGTDAGIRKGEDTARNVSEAMTYQPRTEPGQQQVQDIGKLVQESRLAGMPPSQALSASVVAGPALQQVAGMMPQRTPAGIPGMGAAMTAEDKLRYERSQSLPVPLPMTKGMLTRDFEQQRFERETAKDAKLGKPIRERHAELNDRILQNFDAFVDETGAESVGLRAVGQIVNDAVVTKANRAKDIINTAYEKARESGEMQAPVNVAPLVKYAQDHEPEAINAPVITSLAQKLGKVMAPDGTVSINDLEEVRKMVGTLSGKDATNAHFGKEIKGVIDGLTEQAGGDLYKRARALRTKYAKEFEDVGVIDKLLSTKPGTTDRAVAYEDVFKHTVLSGSLDDVRKVRRTLQTSGENGQQAWKELQGQTVRYIKDEVTKGVTTDERGNTVVSAAKLNRVITELDQDGKLEFMFGKVGSQRLRDISQASKDILTFPPGSVNTSNTASVLLDAVGSAAMGRLPTAAAQAMDAIKRLRRNRATQQQLEDALNPKVSE